MIGKIFFALCVMAPFNGGLMEEGEQSSSEEAISSSEAVASEQSSSEQTVIEKATEVAEDILSKWFTPDKVAMIISWVTYAGTIVVLALKLRNAIKQKNLTLESVKEAVLEAVDGKVSESVKSNMAEFFEKAEKTQEQTQSVLSDFAKILALSQEDSPESRLAILEIIQKIGNVPQEVVSQVKEAIGEEKQESAQLKEEVREIAESWDGTKI